MSHTAPAAGKPVDSTSERLKAFIERVERLEGEKQELSEDIKLVFAEVKATGFDVKIMRQVIKLRKLPASERQEQEELIDVYMRELGMAV